MTTTPATFSTKVHSNGQISLINVTGACVGTVCFSSDTDDLTAEQREQLTRAITAAVHIFSEAR